jgi:hypothetical protein
MKTYCIQIISTLFILFAATNEMLADQNKKTRARIDIEYFNTAINERYLTIKVTTRIEKRYQPVPGAKIDIYLNEISESAKLGSINTNADGKGSYVLPTIFYRALDSLTEFTFFCTLTGHAKVADKESDLLIKEIELKTEYIEQDTLRWIRAIILGKNEHGFAAALEGVEVKFFVIRPFNMLPISDRVTTDEEGKATIQFPDDLPGDATGHITAVVKIDDSDEYGTIERKETIQWGIPTIFDDDSIKRSLWAAGANAPISLLLLTNLLIAVTWGIIFYIVYKIYRISKL